ncbi:MAG: type IV pilus assembly protein PilM [Candidatus Nealsonbacteria bacterium]|nr:type IV pilus assembly protein PilM [Candidatus Nealsonbacteria bacterium]
MFRLFKPKNFLGIDIGASTVKVVELGRKGKARSLENYGEMSVAFGQDNNKGDFFISREIASQAIQYICEEARIKTREANFSIPDFYTFFTNLKIPAINRKDVSEAIKYEIRPYIPLPLSELTLDWLIVNNGNGGKGDMEILAAAIPNDVIRQYQEIAKISHLKLRFLEPEAFALARSVYWSGFKGVVGLIDIGTKSTTCNILEDGILKMSYSFRTAGNELTERLARSLNMDYNKAEEIKMKYGILEGNPSGADNGSYDAKKILSLSLDLIAEEMKKVLRNFYQDKGKEADKVIMTGGTAWMPGLKEYFSGILGKEIIILNPFVNIEHPQVLKNILEAKGPFFAIAAGLALRGLE